jgi:hypothetical protein
LNTPGSVKSVTIGSFTVSDADLNGGGGCSGISLTNTSSSQTADVYTNGAGAPTSTAATTRAPGSPPFTFAGQGSFLNEFQAVLEDGSSMITGIVGSGNTHAQQNGNFGCINVGGIAGT